MAKNSLPQLRICNLFTLFLFLVFTSLNAQEKYPQLEKLEKDNLTCFYSQGSEEKALKISEFCSKAITYFEKILNFKPRIDILVLSAGDWNNYTSFPVYGMPHYTGKETLIVASDDNPFWKSFIPAEGMVSSDFMSRIKEVYVNNAGEISMEAFFELLVIHELGHAYTQQAGITMHRQWLSEFFPNLMLHSFVAETHPDKLPALTLFPEIVIAGGKEKYFYTTLEQLETSYQLIATQHPENYGWFQCRWHKGAADVYNAGGEELLQKFWNAFKANEKKIKEDELSEFLRNIHPSISALYRNWNSE